MSAATHARLNRTDQFTFLESLEAEIVRQKVVQGHVCLLLVQLWNLNDLNLALGYRSVDKALASFASRLKDGFGPTVSCVRIGTKRFAIVLNGVGAESHALLAAKKVERILGQSPANETTPPVKLEAIQGIAIYPQHASRADELLRAADLALMSAKSAPGTIAIHTPAAVSKLSEAARIEAALADALEGGGIETYFQPQIRVASGSVHGAEALLRCRDQDGALLSPELVLQAAARTHRLDALNAAILNTALRYAGEWPSALHNLSVNVSTQDLKNPQFAARILGALSIWGRQPLTFTVEITESAIMEDPQTSFATMRALRDAGVRVAIDDFGTGYSSLSYFKDIPANELKIDKSFVLNMRNSDADRRIVQATINLAHAFELEVVAEGVEDLETVATLRKLGCDLAQGYLIAKPLPPSAYLPWLTAYSARSPA